MRVSLTTSRAACARRKYRGSLVCFKKVSKISRASSGKCSLRVRMRGVSIIKYYKNIKILCQTTGFPSYQNKTFPPQISQELLIHRHAHSSEAADNTDAAMMQHKLAKLQHQHRHGRIRWEQ